jgi:hypothetical protein
VEADMWSFCCYGRVHVRILSPELVILQIEWFEDGESFGSMTHINESAPADQAGHLTSVE